jgi:hypothetical protein
VLPSVGHDGQYTEVLGAAGAAALLAGLVLMVRRRFSS